jgi:hypothetical protein
MLQLLTSRSFMKKARLLNILTCIPILLSMLKLIMMNLVLKETLKLNLPLNLTIILLLKTFQFSRWMWLLWQLRRSERNNNPTWSMLRSWQVMSVQRRVSVTSIPAEAGSMGHLHARRQLVAIFWPTSFSLAWTRDIYMPISMLGW